MQSDMLLATELADYLARKGTPFRKAHSIVGSVVRDCERRKIALKELSLKEFKKYSRCFDADVFRALDVRSSISMKRSEGSTSPKEVLRAIVNWKKRLA
jgi:argininosuccinate lyase